MSTRYNSTFFNVDHRFAVYQAWYLEASKILGSAEMSMKRRLKPRGQIHTTGCFERWPDVQNCKIPKIYKDEELNSLCSKTEVLND